MKTIHLPPRHPGDQPDPLETDGPIVVVGANGSGKTRFGTWLEFNTQDRPVHRIAAQKSLAIPDLIRSMDEEHAQRALLYGQLTSGRPESKLPNRWQGKPNTSLLNDYEHLLVALASGSHAVSAKFHQACIDLPRDKWPDPPQSKLQRIKAIWDKLLPLRRLVIQDVTRIQAQTITEDASTYPGSEMSDGERVILYLIGQALCAPDDAIIIIDEPELHLHKAIQGRLWDEIQRARPDCVFVYLTHDVSFAASRIGAEKIWLRKFTPDYWDWEVAPTGSPISDDVLLKILGSPTPILFVEGDKGSLDYSIYTLVYPELTIEPLGSCERVIQATKSFNSLCQLHDLQAYGLIDRDHRTDSEIASLLSDGVHTLSVVEVENLLLLEDVLRAVANQLCEQDVEDVITKAKAFVLKEFLDDKDAYATRVAHYHTRKMLARFPCPRPGAESLDRAMQEHVQNIRPAELHSQVLAQAEDLLRVGDYDKVLKAFDRKGLVKQIGHLFGPKPKEYIQLVQNMLARGVANAIAPIRSALPAIPPGTLGTDRISPDERD